MNILDRFHAAQASKKIGQAEPEGFGNPNQPEPEPSGGYEPRSQPLYTAYSKILESGILTPEETGAIQGELSKMDETIAGIEKEIGYGGGVEPQRNTSAPQTYRRPSGP